MVYFSMEVKTTTFMSREKEVERNAREKLQHCHLWFFTRMKKSKMFNYSKGECSPGIWS